MYEEKRKAIHFSDNVLLISHSHQQPSLGKRKRIQSYMELSIYISISNPCICPTQQTKSR